MLRTRFSKLLLVALALALWVSAAYGQGSTLNIVSPSGPYALTYTQGDGASQTAAQIPFTIGDNNTGPDTFGEGVNSSAVLTFTCSGGTTVSATSTASCVLGVNPSVADNIAPITNGGVNIQLLIGGQLDTTILVSLTIKPGLHSGTNSIPLTYQVGSESTVQGTSAISASDGSAQSYTKTSTCPSWISVTSGNSLTTPDTLTFAVTDASADTTGITASNTCSVALKDSTGATFQSVTVTYQITAGATTLTSAPTSVTFTYVKGGNTPAAVPTTITDTNTSDTYSANTSAFPAWLQAVSTHSYSIIASHDTLTYSLVAGQLSGLSVGPHTFTVHLQITNYADQTVLVTLNVENASTLSAAPASMTFANYVKTSGTAPTPVTTVITDTNLTTDTDSVGSNPALPGWLSCSVGGSVGNGLTDVLTCHVITAQADALNAGPQSFVVHLQVAGQADALVTVNLTITAAISPLVASPGAITLTYLLGGPQNQTATTQKSVTISSTDPAWDNYTVAGTLPGWLTAVPVASKAKSGTNDSIAFALVTSGLTTPQTITYGVVLHIDAFNTDRTIVVTLNVAAQSMVATPSTVSLTYAKSGGGNSPQTVSLAVLPYANSAPFTVTANTVPVWLTLGLPNPATATTGGVNVTFSVNAAAATGMATGNYTANVALATTAYATPLVIPVAFTISNSAPGLTLKEGTTMIPGIWAPGMPNPNPTWTAVSSDEPIPFTAACVASSTDTTYTVTPSSCVLSSTSGVAYTWGNQLTVTLDSALFASTLGNVVTLAVTVTPTGGGSAVSLSYQYTLQPVRPTLTAMSPTSAAHIPVNSTLVVLLTGTGFVGPGSIKPGTLSETLVWLGSNANPLASTSYVVLSATQLMVTVPETAFPVLTGGKAATLAIGVANQTGINPPAASTASLNLNVTTAPVIYGITSTATYVQPNPGNSPNVAPYDLVSIFGDNFGPTGTNLVTATPDGFSRVPTAITISGSTATKNLVTLTVSFKSTAAKSVAISAPVLFVNENQINTIVPSGLVAGTANVTVTSGTASSDGVFAVNVVTADPGIFTLASDGTGQGAILNHDSTVNQAGNGEVPGQWVSIYMTGLGAPDSTAIDTTGNAATFSTGCVAVSNAGKGTPGYMQVVNTAATGYTPPSPGWTNIDGAVIQLSKIVSGLPPCMTDPVTVVYGPPGNQVTASGTGVGTGVLYAGFVDGSVAGLYQVNAYIPAGVQVGTIPVYVTIGSFHSPPVQMVVKP